MPNIFDVEYESEEPVVTNTKENSPAVSFIAGTTAIAFLAVTVPIYFHVLLKIVNWSWNLI
jgi:hypothetical protein